ESECLFLRTQLLAEWFCERGLLTAGEKESTGHAPYFSGKVELTFLGHPFESLGRAFDTILAIIAIGRKQPDHLIGAAGGRTRDIAGSKIDGLSHGEFVLQHPLHQAKNVGCAQGPACCSRLRTRQSYTMAPAALASYIRTW